MTARRLQRATLATALGAIGLVAGPGATGAGLVPPGEAAARTTWVSQAHDGSAGLDLAQGGALSADGRFGVYQSWANNLVPDDTFGGPDVFHRDMRSGEVTLVSRNEGGVAAGGGAASVSAGGRLVAFCTGSALVAEDTNDASDVYVYRVRARHPVLVSKDRVGGPSDGRSCEPSISADGRFVSYGSVATDLVEGDENGRADIFVTRWRTGHTVLASHGPAGEATSHDSDDSHISGNGRYVTFHSNAPEMVPDDGNGTTDVFVYDRRADQVMRASSTPDGAACDTGAARGSVSANGRFVVFHASATDLVEGDTNGDTDVFRTSIRTGRTEIVTLDPDGGPIDGMSINPSVSDTGRYVAFSSLADNHMPDLPIVDSTIFVRDLRTGTTSLVSQYPDGSPTSDGAYDPNFGGGYISYSTDDALADRDTNGKWDIYRYRRF